MANTNQSVRACVLKVDVKCCSGCQKKASTKLQSLAGVTAAEYNAEKGLMKVTGDVDPMTLVQKLTRSGRKTELISVNYMLDDLISDDEEDEDEDDSSSDDTSSNPDPRPMKRETQVNMRTTMKKKEGILRKYLPFGCFRSKSEVVQPFPLAKRMFGSSRFGNGYDPVGYGNNPYANATTLPQRPPPPFHGPMNPQQQYHMMMQQRQQPPPPPPQFQMTGAPMHMVQQSAPLQQPPYFMQIDPQYRAAAMNMFPQPAKVNPQMTVNHSLHYPRQVT